ncbi:MAG: carbamoyl phosphate synthase small subunit [Balneola sp.]|jgi:carbamoyl-phosphate synthase small subunit|nr:carbamoyl phosphate synthase small subunit [Balneola sp.]MBE77877.1 carbamoyl phosphate synthase small subunit [Balneola sp.]|tara:strand:+ start:184 stop:1287 length:1104 start_codon:yes stop_codon:yes gene_type:complete
MSLNQRKKAILALSDGTIVHGQAVGHEGITGGELCFNTSMTGYQEIFTDPSYYGQLMMMTYPHIGNYGTMPRDDEARKVMVAGIITRAFSWEFSNPMADRSLQEYLVDNEITGISGVDTRMLVRHVREKGVMNAVISSTEMDEEKLVQMAKDWDDMEGLELASKVTRSEAQTVNGADDFRVAAFDYGIKQNIINNLNQRGCTLRIFPAKTSVEEIKEWEADGYFFSNGPGDPTATAEYALEAVNYATQSGKPVFGICLGHQLMALSEGLKTKKMFVGHRGANQPVQNLSTGLVEISTQNHGFAVDEESLDDKIAKVTHINLNDQTIEGLEFKNFPGFSVQYHPEASPGPHDSAYLFDQFIDMMKAQK